MKKNCVYSICILFTISATGIQAESSRGQDKSEPLTRELLRTLANPKVKEEQLMAFHEMREENERLKRQQQEFAQEIRQLKEEVEALHQSTSREKITTVSPIDIFYTDTKAELLVRSNRYGRVRGILKSSGEVIQERESPETSRDHKIVFEKLRDETSYEMEIVALYGGQEIEETRISAEEFPDSLKFRTHKEEPEPYISVERFDITAGNPDSVGIIFFVNQESYVVIKCRYREDAGAVVIWHECPPEGEYSTNEVGKPSGNRDPFSKGYGRIEMTNLQSDTTYEFTPIAYSKFGKESQKISKEYKTEEFESLDFQGPVELKFGPGVLSVSWNATVSPERSSFELFHESLGETYSKEPEVQGNELSASIDIPQLDNMNAEQQQAEIPKIVVTMERHGEKVTREFKFGLVIPPTEKRDDLTKRQRRALENLLKSIESPGQKKLAWKDIADLGFSLALAFL